MNKIIKIHGMFLHIKEFLYTYLPTKLLIGKQWFVRLPKQYMVRFAALCAMLADIETWTITKCKGKELIES